VVSRDAFSAAHGRVTAAPCEVIVVPGINASSQPVIFALIGLVAGTHRSPQAPEAPALAISGKAVTSATTAVFYAFTPTVKQSGNRKLHFSIQNKPAWASFGPRRGTLYGVPSAASAGNYPNIIVSVTDGNTTVNLPAFSIQVDAPLAMALPTAAGS